MIPDNIVRATFQVDKTCLTYRLLNQTSDEEIDIDHETYLKLTRQGRCFAVFADWSHVLL